MSLTDRSWKKRRVVLTRELIVFAFADQDLEIDRVPLAEVLFLKEFKGMSGEEGGSMRRSSTRMLQIATDQHGFNSGRTYYLRVDGDALDEMVKTWSKLARKARRRAEARTLFEKVQREVRRAYDSSVFQTLVALMIAAVRLRSTPPPLTTAPPAQLAPRLLAPHPPQKPSPRSDAPRPTPQNFGCSILEAQYAFEPGPVFASGAALDRINLVFTLLFTAEFAVHAFAYWLRPFLTAWSRSWSPASRRGVEPDAEKSMADAERECERTKRAAA